MKFYYGWWIVAITLLVYTLAVGGTIQAFGLFVLPVSESFHLTRAETNTGAILLNFGMAVAGPILGRLVDRHSARLIMAISAVVLGLSLVVLGLSTNLWLSSVVLAAAVGGSVVGCGTVTSPVLVARWFDHHRGRAMAISTLGVSLGPVVIIPLISLLLEALGWRYSLVLLGGVMGTLLAILAIFVRNEPGIDEAEPGAPAMAAPQSDASITKEKSLGLGRLLQMPQFWTIAMASAFLFAILTTTLVSLVPFAQGQGLPVAQAASAMSVYGVAALLGSLSFAYIGDRFERLTVFAGLGVMMALSAGGLAFAHGYATILACTALMGLSGGGITPGYLALLADRFDTGSFGVASGAASFLSTFVSAIAIRFGGEVFDRTGSYQAMFLCFLALGFIAAALVLTTNLASRRAAVAPALP